MDIVGIEWDRGNRTKCQKHGVPIDVIEVLFNAPLAILPDDAHSETERRFKAIGRTKTKRAVFIVFTLRKRDGGVWIRPISARYMHNKEIKAYEKENPNL
jgi:uncharacterized protein